MKPSILHASGHGYRAGPNMTPLVDVVMVILIFLMLAGSFGTKEIFLEGRTGVEHISCLPPVLPKPPVTTLDVFVSDSGAGSHGFAARVSGRTDPLTDPADLRAELTRRRADYAAAGTRPESIQIVIHPSAGTAWAPVVWTYEAAVGARFEKVGFGFAVE